MCDYVGNLSYYLVADISSKGFIRKAATMSMNYCLVVVQEERFGGSGCLS